MELSEHDVRATIVAIIQQLAPGGEDWNGRDDLSLVEGLGFHSLALLELAFAIEDDFDLPPIDEETGRTITTTGRVIGYVIGELREQGDLAASGADAAG